MKRFFREKPSEPAGEIEVIEPDPPPEMIAEHTYTRSFDELRTGFTAAVSHELRTPLARILALLDSADLPGADVRDLIDKARAEVENAGALIDEILFLSELESGREIVSLGHTSALPVLEGVVRDLEDAAVEERMDVLPLRRLPRSGRGGATGEARRHRQGAEGRRRHITDEVHEGFGKTGHQCEGAA